MPVDGRKPSVRILRVDARLERVAADGELLLRQRQRLARRDAQLPFDQVLPGDHLGDRMLDLQPRVHLHEEEAAVLVGDELDRARADVADRARGRDRGLAHLAAARLGHAGRRRLLQHLLVTPLHRAVALEQVHAVAVGVGEHLDLDVARARDVFLDQHLVVAEARRRFALARRERLRELARRVDDAHALAAAARGGLEQHRIADAVRFFLQKFFGLFLSMVTGHQRHRRLLHQRLRRALAAHGADRRGRRADEHDARSVAQASAKSSFSDRKP